MGLRSAWKGANARSYKRGFAAGAAEKALPKNPSPAYRDGWVDGLNYWHRARRAYRDGWEDGLAGNDPRPGKDEFYQEGYKDGAEELERESKIPDPADFLDLSCDEFDDEEGVIYLPEGKGGYVDARDTDFDLEEGLRMLRLNPHLGA